jgi:hypothetical protein
MLLWLWPLPATVAANRSKLMAYFYRTPGVKLSPQVWGFALSPLIFKNVRKEGRRETDGKPGTT